jgi:hypothetical protein
MLFGRKFMVIEPRHLTKRWSEPLTVLKSKFMVHSLLLIERELAVVSGRSALSR